MAVSFQNLCKQVFGDDYLEIHEKKITINVEKIKSARMHGDSERKMDFPFFTNIEIDKNPMNSLKKIMVIGNDPGPNVKRVGICYGVKKFELDPAENRRDLASETRFWKCLLSIFVGKEIILDKIHEKELENLIAYLQENTFVTDCYQTNMNQKFDPEDFIFPVIRFISPQIIIFHGKKCKDYMELNRNDPVFKHNFGNSDVDCINYPHFSQAPYYHKGKFSELDKLPSIIAIEKELNSKL